MLLFPEYFRQDYVNADLAEYQICFTNASQ